MNLQQSVNWKNVNIKGDWNMNVNQSQAAALTFNCLQSSTVRNSAASDIITKLTNNIASSATSEALALLDANAKSAAKQGFGGIGKSSSDTNVNTISNFKSENETHMDIENLVKNIVQNNFTSEDLQTCLSQANSSQNITMQEINVGGNAVLALNQEQASTVVTNCIQESNISNNIINNVMSELGVKIDNESIAVSKAEATAVAESKAETQGVGDAVGDVFRGMGQGFGEAVGSIFSGVAGLFQNPMFAIVCCICVLVIGVVAYIAISKGGDIIKDNPELLMV